MKPGYPKPYSSYDGSPVESYVYAYASENLAGYALERFVIRYDSFTGYIVFVRYHELYCNGWLSLTYPATRFEAQEPS